MPIAGCCPSCGFKGEVEAFLVEPDAKRMIARVAAIDADLGRVLMPYLRLFSAGVRGLRLSRALALIDELLVLVNAGNVCRDERVGVRRPASVAMWVAGIETVLATPPTGALTNHHYLRAVVFGLADQADAAAEKQREADRANGRKRDARAPEVEVDVRAERRRYARQMGEFSGWTVEQQDEYVTTGRSPAPPGNAP